MNIAVIGAGAWGTTLAILLSKNGHPVKLWSYEPDKNFLPGFDFPKTGSDKEALESARVIIFAVPSKYFRKIVKRFAALINTGMIIVSATKGLEEKTYKRMSEILREELKAKKIVVLSGPNLSKEVAAGLPAATVAAAKNIAQAKKIQQVLMNDNFRVYTSTDITGVELGGALKNTIAIAAGMLDELKLGANAKAGLMVRGMAEMTRLSLKLGAKPQTLAGLSGMGDLIATCSSQLSRNHRVGSEIAKGKTVSEISKNMTEVAEGIQTTQAAYALAKKFKIEMPITAQIYQVLFENKNPRQAILDLMTRQAKTE